MNPFNSIGSRQNLTDMSSVVVEAVLSYVCTSKTNQKKNIVC